MTWIKSKRDCRTKKSSDQRSTDLQLSGAVKSTRKNHLREVDNPAKYYDKPQGESGLCDGISEKASPAMSTRERPDWFFFADSIQQGSAVVS